MIDMCIGHTMGIEYTNITKMSGEEQDTCTDENTTKDHIYYRTLYPRRIRSVSEKSVLRHNKFVPVTFFDNLVENVQKRYKEYDERKLHEDNVPVCSKTCARFMQAFSLVAMGITTCCLLYLDKESVNSTLVIYLHLLSFAAHFGAQCWVTFVAGITMFFNLPRIMFGRLQCRLFPLYFGSCLGLSCVTLVTYVLSHPQEERTDGETSQVWYLGACVLFTWVNSCVLAPHLVGAMIKMFELEKDSEIAYQVGFCDRTELKKNPVYMKYYTQFRTCHSVSGTINLLTMFTNLVYMYQLACSGA